MNTATTKTALVTAVLILATIFPIGETQTFKITLLTGVISFFFGLFLTPLTLFNSLRKHLTIKKPEWADKFDDKVPLTYIHFIGLLSLTMGIGQLLGGVIVGQIVNFTGTVFFVAGLGVLAGMYFTLTRTQASR